MSAVECFDYRCRYCQVTVPAGLFHYCNPHERRKPAVNANNAARFERVAALRAEGLTHAEIGKAVGLSTARVWQILNHDLALMRIRQQREAMAEKQQEHHDEIRSARHLPYPTDVHSCALLAEVGALLAEVDAPRSCKTETTSDAFASLVL